MDSDPTECFKIKEVLGVSWKMSKTEKRLGCDYDDDVAATRCAASMVAARTRTWTT